MENKKVNAPWLDNYGTIEKNLKYDNKTLFFALFTAYERYPDHIAFDFMGKKTNYRDFFCDVSRCARALRTLGIKKGDRITIALPNCPQALIMFYAINAVGAVSNMIHPLSSENEIKFFINKV